ncbi:hypothetical protein F5B20DRAFT_586510 [Whalleya microplaca]|nr:hypothetical protein F5B20DRAFT_586510 [Whalleya microplaca]
MSLSAPTPPLLLTKRLTAFLHTNLTPQIHTALLITLSGKLLAHASPHPVGTLRTQCTVAASLWALYSSPAAGTTVTDALPPQTAHAQPPTYGPPTPSAVTLQLAGAVVVIRLLRCGLLFVCIGPTTSSEGGEHGAQAQAQAHTRPVQTPQPQQQGEAQATTPPLGSPSEAGESVASAGAATTASIATTASVATAAVVVMRRQAEELARWLDDKLGSLGVPEEALGMDVR